MLKQHEDRLYPENWLPFGNAVTTDPFSGETGAILKGRSTDPLMIEVNTYRILAKGRVAGTH